jgi:hypothetical protein
MDAPQESQPSAKQELIVLHVPAPMNPAMAQLVLRIPPPIAE